MDKTILLASFIFPERLDWFIDYLNTKFQINRGKVFCYENLEDISKVIVTFKLVIPAGKHLDLKNLFPNAIIIHKRGNALYTINALNKLIEELAADSLGNVDHKSITIDWSEYQNKLILVDNKELVIHPIKRVF